MTQCDIMVVDDNPANLKLLEDMLVQRGYRVRSFPLGRLALAAAAKKPPDLILVDINMPEMNGYEVCARLKSTKELSDIPVIFLSALNEIRDKIKAFQAGAADYISKPFQIEEVSARVETHLKLYSLQRALQLQNERLEESAADIIFRIELYPHPHIAYINPAATSIVGYSPAEHYADQDLFLKIIHPDDRHLIEMLIRGGSSSGSTVTLRYVRRDGKQIWLEQHHKLVPGSDGRLIAIEGIARDITERRYLEEQLRQSQKMEAIGLLAGGVAHDFNNLLTVIIGYSELIVCDDAPAAPIMEKMVEVRKAADRAVALTRQLLAFGRRQLVRPTALDVNTVIESSSKMLRRVIGANIEFVTALGARLGPIKADEGQIEQVLVNLVVNANGAMPQGGRITIETQDVTVDDTLTAGALGATGPFVMLAVSDTGCGMDTSTQARIFEPFFTTKELGKGTGLGLSIVYGIVEQSAGHIKVFSEPGHGARFEILFPRFEMVGANPDLTVLPSQLPVGSDTSSMVHLPLSAEAVTILLADDDPGVRELTQLVLEHQGYRVFACANGVEAIEHARQHPASIHLLLTDVAMPEMGGEELVAQFAACCPGIPVLYMSAYHDKQRAGIAAVGCLLKPFTPAALLESVRTRLNACDASG